MLQRSLHFNLYYVVLICSFLLSYTSFAQLTLNPEKKQPEIETKQTEKQVLVEKENDTDMDNKDDIEDEVTDDKIIPPNFSVLAKTWGVGAGLSLNTVISPKELDGETNAGAGFQMWGRYQFNEHVGSQFGLYEHDFSDSSFGITALKYSFLFQTGWPEGFYPFFGVGLSLNNVNKSEIYGKDYTALGWQMNLGAHIPSENLGNRAFFIPQVEFFQVFEKNNDAKAISGLAFIISLGYFFDAEDFTKNVSLINGK